MGAAALCAAADPAQEAPEFRPPSPEQPPWPRAAENSERGTSIRTAAVRTAAVRTAPPFSAAGGRHGTPDRGERDSRGADPWGQAPQRWQEPPNHGAGRRGEPRSSDELRDKLRATDLIAPRKIESSSGWRKALFVASGGLINVGESADERKVRALKAAVNANVRGTYTIAVLGGKGGAGKTAMTAAVSSVFADLRRNDRVVAIDADPAQAANLATRVDPKAASMREINSDMNLHRYADVRALTGQMRSGSTSSPHRATRGRAEKP